MSISESVSPGFPRAFGDRFDTTFLRCATRCDLPTNRVPGSRRGTTLDAENFLQRRNHFPSTAKAPLQERSGKLTNNRLDPALKRVSQFRSDRTLAEFEVGFLSCGVSVITNILQKDASFHIYQFTPFPCAIRGSHPIVFDTSIAVKAQRVELWRIRLSDACG